MKILTLSLSRIFSGSGSQSQHIITASLRLYTVVYMFRLTGGHQWKPLEKIQTSSWLVPSHLFRLCSPSLLCKLHSGLSLSRRCFTLCERPMAENWQIAAAVKMWLHSVKRATHCPPTSDWLHVTNINLSTQNILYLQSYCLLKVSMNLWDVLCYKILTITFLWCRFDFCSENTMKRPSENLGQVLFGERIEPSPYKVTHVN